MPRHSTGFVKTGAARALSDADTAATIWIGDVVEFAARDMLAIAVTAVTAGCAATDLVVGVVLGRG